MFKLLGLLIVIGVSASCAEEPCDKIWESISKSCLEVRSSIVTNANSPKAACCNNVKYNMCVKTAVAYSAIAKLTKVCPDEVYDQKISNFQSPLDLISTLCTNFNFQTCVADSIGNYWAQMSSHLNTKAIGDTIEQNFNSAVDQLSAIAKSVGQSINEQRIPERFAAGAESIRRTFNEQTKGLSNAIAPNRDINRYSLVGEKEESSGVDELVDSIFPSVEIVEKGTDNKSAEPAKPLSAKRYPFLDWFQSGYERASSMMKGIGKGAAAVNPPQSQGSSNPYSNKSE